MEITPITPITALRVCKGVPLDASYTDTMTFASAAAQAAYFAGKTKYSYANLTPIRFNKDNPGAIYLPLVQDNLFDCNYICFQNANFGSKWFYAFITGIKYYNPNNTEVTIKLDVMQTWMFDYTIKPSFVIREHPNSDAYGEHTLLEPLEIGEMVDEEPFKSGHLSDYDAVIMYAQNDGLGDGIVGGTFTGLTYMHTPLSGPGAGAMLDLLQSLVNTNRADSVVATYIMPSDFYTKDAAPNIYNLNVPMHKDSIGGYTPRNKKLLCYPYNMLCVSNTMGTVKTYRYEYFGSLNYAIFKMSCPMGVNPEVICYPNSYDNQSPNINESISLSGFPQFAFVIDTFRAWFAQNGNTYAVNFANQLANTAMSMATENVSGAISGTMGIGSTVAGFIDHINAANTSRGVQSSNALTALRQKDFYFWQRHVREDYAKVLDDYFDMYGYLTNRVKVPNITGRPSWNYVRTQDAKVTGSIPFDDIVTIKQNLDRGITFWHGDFVGDYSRANGV